MKVAYLVNQYPHITHTFIRREILALEMKGVSVARVSIRRSAAFAIDPADRAEAEKTLVLLEQPLERWALAVFQAARRSPFRFVKALAWALSAGPAHGERRGLIRSVAYFAEACLFAEIVRASGASRVHAHFGTNSTLVAALTHLLDRVPFSFTVHGPEELAKAPRLALARKVRLAASVAAISDYTRRELGRWCEGTDAEKIHVVRCGVEASRFERNDDASSTMETRFLCVARLAPEKGIEILLEALSRLSSLDAPFRLILIGDGPLRSAIEDKIRALGIESRVELRGWRDNQEVAAEMKRASYVVCPSFAEGLPVVLIEAMAGGRPVLASRIAGIPELVEPGRSGWLVEAGNIGEWERSLKEAIALPRDLRSAMGAEARVAALARHRSDNEAVHLASSCFGFEVAA